MVSRSFPWVGTKPRTVAGFGPTGSGKEVLLLCGGGPALLFLDKKKKGKGPPSAELAFGGRRMAKDSVDIAGA